jgi:hypothetical protein
LNGRCWVTVWVIVLVFVTVDGATVVVGVSVGVTVTVLTLGVSVSVGVSVAAGGAWVSVTVCGACELSWLRCVGAADELGDALAGVVAAELGVVDVFDVFVGDDITFTRPKMTAASTATAMIPAITNAAVVRYHGVGGGGGGSGGAAYLAACVGSE